MQSFDPSVRGAATDALRAITDASFVSVLGIDQD
jgi:hypothetical protein